MGHSQEEKAKSRERIVEVAAARIRESGTVEPGVAEIMKAAGLTHGGFYKHFASRDELVAEAVASALGRSGAVAESWVDGADDPLAAFVDRYLSGEHRDQPAAGCAVAALVGDVSRGPQELQASFGGQVERYILDLQRLLAGRASTDGSDLADRDGIDRGAHGDEGLMRAQAVVAVSALVGALALSRAVADPILSDELLGSVRQAITSGSLGA